MVQLQAQELAMGLGDRLWSCDNDYDSEVTYVKGTALRSRPNRGICAGQSALWCYNVESGIRDIYSKPDLGRAIILQRLVDWSHDPGKLLETAGLKITEFGPFQDYETPCLHIETHPGTYYISLKGHAVAARTVVGYFYGFDPNFGLYRYNVSGKLAKLFHMSSESMQLDKSKGMEVFKVETL